MAEALVYTVGDSHSIQPWHKIPFVDTNPCGPMTMHHVGINPTHVDGSPILYVESFPKNAIVVFCWGEIDCRWHVHKFQPWKDTIDKLVEDYLVVVRNNAKITPNIWLFNVVPPPHRSTAIESAGFPFLGSDDERLQYVRYMNSLLAKSGFPFVDVYDRYADPDGFLIYEMSDAHVHLRDPQPLEDWLLEHVEGAKAHACQHN